MSEKKIIRLSKIFPHEPDYFEQHHGEVLDHVDLLNAFDLPLPLIVEASEALEGEGEIAGVD